MSARASVTLHHPHSHALAVASLFMRACRRHRSQAVSDLVCRERGGAGADGGKISRDFRDHSFSTDHIARAQLVTVQRVRVCVDCVHSCVSERKILRRLTSTAVIGKMACITFCFVCHPVTFGR
eukprot:COSAG05_NODE_613_length_8348_cov_10.272275_6_plen_124_part_00